VCVCVCVCSWVTTWIQEDKSNNTATVWHFHAYATGGWRSVYSGTAAYKRTVVSPSAVVALIADGCRDRRAKSSAHRSFHSCLGPCLPSLHRRQQLRHAKSVLSLSGRLALTLDRKYSTNAAPLSSSSMTLSAISRNSRNVCWVRVDCL